jgi:hypothetical protein
MDRAAAENGSRWDAETTAAGMRQIGHDVQIVEGDWGASYTADTDDEHAAMLSLED